MSPKYIISHLDEQSGPFDEAELKAKWVKGEILPIDYVYDEAKSDWILLAERFNWASSKAETDTPPPITVRKANSVMHAVEEKRIPIEIKSDAKPVIETKPVVEAKHETLVKAAVPTATPTAPASSNGAKVKLTDGEGEIDLASLQPGEMQLVLQDQSAGTLKLENPLKITVRPAEPVAIEWSLVEHQTVGQDLEIQIQALDRSGNVCRHYEDSFTIRVNGGDLKQIPVQMRDGQALIKIAHTKAELWRLTFHYNGSRVLKLPEDRKLEWQPGPATKLILDGPQEYVAGHPLKVHVKAVDNYGNLATTFQGTVILEVKAS